MSENEERIQKPGQYEIDEFYLINRAMDEPFLDLRNFAISTVIYEDVFSAFLHGEIVIVDAKDAINNYGIFGGEVITIKFRTTELEDTPENIIEKSFAVYSIKNRGPVNDRQQTYTLGIISLEAYADPSTPIMKAFPTSGGKSPDALAQEIFDEYIAKPRVIPDGEPTTISISDTPHEGEIAYLSNNWTPIQNMNYLTNFSVGGAGIADFVFYESNKSFFYTSLSTMISAQLESPFDLYTYVQKGQPSIDKGQFEELTNASLPYEFTQCESVEIPRTIDVIDGQRTGQYASNTIMYDLFSGEKETIVADIRQDFLNLPKTEGALGTPAGVPRHSAAKTNMMYGNSILNTGSNHGFGTTDGAYVKGAGGYAFAKSSKQEYLNSFKDYTFKITVPGRTDIEVGRIISLYYPRMISKISEETTGGDAIDPVLSGNYLVTAIRHEFTPDGAKQIMEIVKNGLLGNIGPDDDEINIMT